MKKDETLSRDLRELFVRQFYNHGLLDKGDLNLTDKEFTKKFLHIFKNEPWAIVIDHRDDIAQQADSFLASGQHNYAALFYAMFFEHSLNNIISEQCIKRKIDEKTAIEVIRCTDIHAKLTWLPKLLGLPKFNENHIKIIKRVSEDRNAFVHYKWKAESDEPTDPNKETEEFRKYFKQVKGTVKYVRQFNSRLMFNGLKKKIDKKIRTK